MGYLECQHVCAQLNAGFGCIGEADVKTLTNLLPTDMKWYEGGWAFIGSHTTTPGNNNKLLTWSDPNCTTTLSEWDEGQPDDYQGDVEDCVAVHRDFEGWHDFPCCGWAQCICNSDVPVSLSEKLNETLCTETCRTEYENMEDMCAAESCAGCRECGNIGLQTRAEHCRDISGLPGLSKVTMLMLMLFFVWFA